MHEDAGVAVQVRMRKSDAKEGHSTMSYRVNFNIYCPYFSGLRLVVSRLLEDINIPYLGYL